MGVRDCGAGRGGGAGAGDFGNTVSGQRGPTVTLAPLSSLQGPPGASGEPGAPGPPGKRVSDNPPPGWPGSGLVPLTRSPQGPPQAPPNSFPPQGPPGRVGREGKEGEKGAKVSAGLGGDPEPPRLLGGGAWGASQLAARRSAPPDCLPLVRPRGNPVLMGLQGGQAQWGLEGPLDEPALRVSPGSRAPW